MHGAAITITGIGSRPEDIGPAEGETSPLCGLAGGPPYRCGGLGVLPIIITLARLFRALEAFLHRSLAKRFIVLQIDDGLISDVGEIAIRARERLDAGFAGE